MKATRSDLPEGTIVECCGEKRIPAGLRRTVHWNGSRCELWDGAELVNWRMEGETFDFAQYRIVNPDARDRVREEYALARGQQGLYPLHLDGISDYRKDGPGAWLASLTSEERKEVAIERGLFAYFPDALALVARHSVRSNEKHNPGQPVHWAREKSTDHGDCIARHHLAVSVDRDSLDGGQPHIVCRAWRALADLQIWVEEKHAKGEKV